MPAVGSLHELLFMLAQVQSFRYDLDGAPLPYSRDNIFLSLFPMPKVTSTTIGRAEFSVQSTPKRTYAPQDLPSCPYCSSKRIFECQLMPNLISILRPVQKQTKEAQTDAERRQEIEQLIKGNTSKGALGMEWGTCMVFSCAKDCCMDENRGSEKLTECWREEYLLVQWED